MPHLLNRGADSWRVEGPSEFEAFFLPDTAIEDGWFVRHTQHASLGAGWIAYRNPIKTLVAWNHSEVTSLLDSLDDYSAQGLTAGGFVSFDASPAFDRALEAKRADQLPLACFHLYKDRPGFYKELLCTQSDENLQIDWSPEIEREQFLEKCEQIKRHLQEGDTYQVNLSLRFQGQFGGNMSSLFASLAAESPPPYACLFLSKEVNIASLSPELFFERCDQKIRCRPMKGTAAVGKDLAETRAQADRLHLSEKNRAENLMIVDMIRNDLGRIAEVGSVQTTSIFEVEAFPTVLQMTSTVEANVNRTLRETFDALFPCASIVGAPKVATVKIIRDLEESPRGVYTGAIGSVGPSRRSKFAVAIRTISSLPGSTSLSYGAGSGIVWDSVPEDEWRETLLKTEALRHSSSDWSLIETFRWPDDPDNPRIDLHLDRIEGSSRLMGIPFDRCKATAAIHEACDQSLSPLRVRLLNGYRSGIKVETLPLGSLPTSIAAALATEPVCSRDPALRIKSNRRTFFDRQLQHRGTEEVLLWNESGEVTEFCKGNLVAKIDGRFITPPLESGLLPGIFRQVLLQRNEIVEQKIDLKDLSAPVELYRINSLTGWIRARLLSETDTNAYPEDVD